MGSLETGGISFKRDNDTLVRSYSAGRTERHPFLYRPRSSFSRFLRLKKLDYIQWICTVAVFLFFVLLFQMFLPGSVVEKSEIGSSPSRGMELNDKGLLYLKEIGGLDFGEDIKFQPSKILRNFRKENREMNMSCSNRTLSRFPYRKPQLALVFADLLVDPYQLLMVTVATALQEIGYTIHVYSLGDGPAQSIWKRERFQVNIIQISHKMEIAVDWLNYDGILVNSLETKSVFSCFMQEPFKSVPLIWTINERALATRSRQYTSSWQIELLNDWRKAFNRATVVVFPNHVLPMMYSAFDTGNYYVIPASPAEIWETETTMALYNDEIHVKMGHQPNDFVIAIVGSQFLYRGLWLEHALVLKALLPVFTIFSLDNNSKSHLKIIVLSGDPTGNYSAAVEAIAVNLSYPRGTVKHFAVDDDVGSLLSAADLVIYGSFLEEQSFPEILVKAMSIGKPIITPDLSMIRKYLKIEPITSWNMEMCIKVQKADRSRNDLHERDEGELLRTGQPLCIYEPYFGEGTWSFLHLSSLYRGIGLGFNRGEQQQGRLAFSEALKRMYGIKHDLEFYHHAEDGDTWSVMLSFALPTRSSEFVMFSRSLTHVFLELLINVWAYHSARQMVYVNPETGLMQEQHAVKSRRGKIWVKWFSTAALRAWTRLAEEQILISQEKMVMAINRRGCMAGCSKERNLRNHQKEKRDSKQDKQQRMRKNAVNHGEVREATRQRQSVWNRSASDVRQQNSDSFIGNSYERFMLRYSSGKRKASVAKLGGLKYNSDSDCKRDIA
uniref:Glycosyl transferase family 1 domain-containing protein n=1 Tax=Salix viminalis TaxID=40686 RepID=A0A6N2MD68_SALVM